MDTNKRKVFIFSAPSGSGKTTLVHALLKAGLPFSFSISATSRPKRATEIDKKDYYFVSPDEFRQMVAKGEFIEWEEVYSDIAYGTLKSEIERIFKSGKYPIFDVDVVGGLNLKKYFLVDFHYSLFHYAYKKNKQNLIHAKQKNIFSL